MTDGMAGRVYPESACLLDELDEAPLPGDARFDLARSRAETSATAPPWTGSGAVHVQDSPVAGVPCRWYLPLHPVGVVVHAHGGGFVEGDLDTHDALCRELAVTSDWAIVAVDYRLAPEHPYPAAFEDMEAVAGAVTAGGAERGLGGIGAHVPHAPVALLGDSAGAMLVAGMTLRERRARGDRASGYALQVLVYPDCGHFEGLASVPEIEQGFGLTPAAMRWYLDAFAPDPGVRDHEDIAALRTTSYAGLPPAVVITAELDPLRESAEEYAARLAGAGVPVVCTRYCGAVHGFWRRPGRLRAATAAVDQVAGALRRVAAGQW